MIEQMISLSREVQATQIPSGVIRALPAGTKVSITQALGGSYTIVIDFRSGVAGADGEPISGMFRIAPEDADALGKEKVAMPATVPADGPFDEAAVWAQLKTCYDPEIPVNIVDLGLVYSLEAIPHEKGGTFVTVKMTLTAPGCGMGPSIAADAQRKILVVSGVTDASVEVVWDPPWDKDRISPDGKAKLGMV